MAEQRHARAQHASATACMESSWPRTKYDPITWRRLLVCWAPELGVSQPSTTKAQSRARPNRHHGQRQKRTVSFPPLTPPLSGWWAKAQSHRHTLFPFGLDLSSIVFCLWSFRSPGIPRAYGGCNSMTDANDPTLCSISNFVLPA